MKEIKVPVEVRTDFSHYCEDCPIAELTLKQAYGKYTLTCCIKSTCDKLWKGFMERGLVKRKEE